MHDVAVVVTLSLHSAQSRALTGRVDHVWSGCSNPLPMITAGQGWAERAEAPPDGSGDADGLQRIAEHGAGGLDRSQERVGLDGESHPPDTTSVTAARVAGRGHRGI